MNSVHLKKKTTCSLGRQSRGICDSFNDVTDLILNDPIYIRNYPENSDKYWRDFGNEYAEYCPISLSEATRSTGNKYSYIGNYKLGEKEKYGVITFYYWLKQTKENDYSVFSPNYGKSFSNNLFCAFSSIIQKDDLKEVKTKNLFFQLAMKYFVMIDH